MQLNKISPVFWGLLALMLLSGYLLWPAMLSARIWALVFVLSGWVVSLSLHEFGHAFTAYVFGDYSVEEKGYLTLNPLHYTQVLLSIVMPLVFLMMGGIGLPGGAVYIDYGKIRTRMQRSLVSVAGPLANIILTIILLLVFHALHFSGNEHMPFRAAMALLIFLQISAVLLNLLPIPGLDGFGIIEPFLSAAFINRIRNIAGMVVLILFALLFSDTFLSRAFWEVILKLSKSLGLSLDLIRSGLGLIQFWD